MSECCCHGLDAPCAYGDTSRHVHSCPPRYLDLGGHCPDDGCAGACWANSKPTATPPTTRTDEESQR